MSEQAEDASGTSSDDIITRDRDCKSKFAQEKIEMRVPAKLAKVYWEPC